MRGLNAVSGISPHDPGTRNWSCPCTGTSEVSLMVAGFSGQGLASYPYHILPVLYAVSPPLKPWGPRSPCPYPLKGLFILRRPGVHVSKVRDLPSRRVQASHSRAYRQDRDPGRCVVHGAVPESRIHTPCRENGDYLMAEISVPSYRQDAYRYRNFRRDLRLIRKKTMPVTIPQVRDIIPVTPMSSPAMVRGAKGTAARVV